MSILDYYRPRTKEALLQGKRVPWIHGRKDRGRYIHQCVLSFPPWVNKKELRVIWQVCRDLEKQTGIPHVLDHIIPISHPNVCGLSVPWNLRPLPRHVNDAKGNKWHPDQLELFHGI